MTYSKKLLEHFQNPQNQGRIKDADAVGIVGNPTCGDMMKIYLKIEKDRITDIKFETLGCAAAIATSSVLTKLAKGKTVQEALKITKDDIIRELGEMPPNKIHCSVLGAEGLKKAIKKYQAGPDCKN